MLYISLKLAYNSIVSKKVSGWLSEGGEKMLRTQSKIRSIREKKGITLAQLAEKVGKSAPYLSDIERGNRRGSYATLQKIANALGVDVEQIREVS